MGLSIQDLGSLGEFVGAFAVVITLLYLAVQVRQTKTALDANTKAVRAQALSDVTRNSHSELLSVINGEDIASVLLKLLDNDEMDDRERVLADAWLTTMFLSRQSEYFQFKDGLLDERLFVALQHPIFVFAREGMGRQWWEEEGQSTFSEEFVAHVNDRLTGDHETRSWWLKE